MEGPKINPRNEHAPFLRASRDLYTDYIVPVAELPQSYRDEIDPGYTTGWSDLDRLLMGIRLGEVTVISADTGSGKTTFATQLLCNVAMQGVAVWINSWEMAPSSIVRKMASLVLRKNMKLERFTVEDNSAFDAWCLRYRVFLNPVTIGLSLEQLAEQLKKAAELGIKVVLLDHLDYLVHSRREKHHEDVDATVKALHEMAFLLKMHLILICHPKQSATGQEEIGIHSLKGSSSIKQYADNIIVLHRCSRTDSQAHSSKTKVRVVKNRALGSEGTTYLFYEAWDGYTQIKEIHARCSKEQQN
jgi:replicative DNA helicase